MKRILFTEQFEIITLRKINHYFIFHLCYRQTKAEMIPVIRKPKNF